MSAVQTFDIPAGPLDATLTGIARQGGQIISIQPGQVKGLTAPAIQGRLSAEQAYRKALEHSGLELFTNDSGALNLRPVPAKDTATLPTVTVNARHADASYAGGQVARGARAGLLGKQDVMDTPFNITNYTAQTIQDQQARSIADVVANDPSVRNVWSASSYTGPLVMRGFAVSNQDVAFDGLYGIAPALTVLTDFVDRVEVLKGPNALLNGMAPFGSVGGGINVVPKRAGDDPLTQLSVNYASDSQFGTHIDFGRRFGDDNAFGVRFNGSWRDGDTAVDRQSQTLGAAVLGLDYRGKNMRLSADFGYQRQDFDSPLRPTYVAAGGAVPSAPDNTANWFQPWAFVDTRDTFGVLRGEIDLNDDWTAYAAYGGRSNRFNGLTGFANGTAADGSFTDAESYFPSWSDSRSMEAGLRGRARTGVIRHELALNATRLELESGSLFLPVASIPSNLNDPVFVPKPAYTKRHVPKTSETTLTSFALADTLSMLDDRVRLTLGARLQKVEVDNVRPTVADYDKDAITPALGLVVKPWQDVSLYANYIQGLQQGTTVGAGYANTGEAFPPYRSRQYEVGVKRDWGRFATTVSLFQITQPSTTVANNVMSLNGEQRNRGIEINTFGEAARGVRLLGGVMFIDGELTKTQGGVNDGNDAIGVPHVQINLGGEWDTPFLPGLTLSARAIHTSRQYVDAANTQSIPDWTRFDIGARYALKVDGRPVMLRANVENLFDKRYWASANSGFGLSPGAPRTVLLSATMDF